MCHRDHRRSTWIVYMMTLFTIWTGVDALNMYSNRLLTKMNEESGDEDKGITVSPNLGTILFGLANMFGALLGFFSVHNFGRVRILVVGHAI